jgi:hypothetical protein
LYSKKKIIFIILGASFLILGFYNHIASNELKPYDETLAADYTVYGIVADVIAIILIVIAIKTKARTTIPKYAD